MKVIISGSHGMIGSALVRYLRAKGHDVIRLVRSRQEVGEGSVFWDPETRRVDEAGLDGSDVIVHLAGQNIGDRRWTEEYRRTIRDSREVGTRFLCETLARLANPPSLLVAASAVGYYGDRGSEVLTEESSPGDDFLANVCKEWEAAAQPAKSTGIRVIHLRLGVVLSRRGGALAKMLTSFRYGLGGVIGSGRQYWSWIALDDVLGAIEHCMGAVNLAGPVNCTAPEPVTNREFTKTLAAVLRRPTILPVPAYAVRFFMGEMGNALLLASTRVEPRRLIESGYSFRFATLESALRHILGCP